MPSDSQSADKTASSHYLPRKVELAAFAECLPLNGVEVSSKRVFNLWGEKSVGKSSFISEFRESEIMTNAKVLWLQPTRMGKLDTIPEFIRACSKTIRYPAHPDKEKKISELLESVQRGKVNPIVSDDSILITRTSIAKNKKPYVNQAAAASVGRTEKIQDDIEINVGLGESKATNHAEGFLDALPLQSLGTDLTILYLENLDNLSITIIDWLRDYVFPSAIRGAYRRSLIILLESLDPIKLAYPNETWGEWASALQDFQLYPLSEDDSYSLAIKSGLTPEQARFVFLKSFGYPLSVLQSIKSIKGSQTDTLVKLPQLSPAEQVTLAALCLPNRLYPEDLDVLFGANNGATQLAWLESLPGVNLSQVPDSKAKTLPDSLRCAAIASVANQPSFVEYRKRWAPMAKLVQNVPSRAARSKLLLLAGLLWIDDAFCARLFGEQADKVVHFIQKSPELFNRNQERYRVSERIREHLRSTAKNLGHIGLGAILKKATKLWEERKEEIEASIAECTQQMEKLQGEANSLSRQHSELLAQIRIQERKTEEEPPSETKPSFLSKIFSGRTGSETDTARSISTLRKQSSGVNHHLQETEARIEDLKQEVLGLKQELRYSYVQLDEDQ